MSMNNLRDDPEYETRWPNDILAAELDRLVELGRSSGQSAEWRDEVGALLRQAFRSAVPEREFQQRWDDSGSWYDPAEEPF